MTLVGADEQAVGGNGETRLVAVCDDFAQRIEVEWNIGFGDQLVDVGPSFGIEDKVDNIRFVAKDVAKKFAGIGEGELNLDFVQSSEMKELFSNFARSVRDQYEHAQ